MMIHHRDQYLETPSEWVVPIDRIQAQDVTHILHVQKKFDAKEFAFLSPPSYRIRLPPWTQPLSIDVDSSSFSFKKLDLVRLPSSSTDKIQVCVKEWIRDETSSPMFPTSQGLEITAGRQDPADDTDSLIVLKKALQQNYVGFSP